MVGPLFSHIPGEVCVGKLREVVLRISLTCVFQDLVITGKLGGWQEEQREGSAHAMKNLKQEKKKKEELPQEWAGDGDNPQSSRDLCCVLFYEACCRRGEHSCLGRPGELESSQWRFRLGTQIFLEQAWHKSN